MLITDRLSRRVDMFADTAAEFTAEGMPSILVNQRILYVSAHAPYSRTMTSSCAPRFHELNISTWVCANLPQAPIIQTVTEAWSGQTKLYPKSVSYTHLTLPTKA